MLPFRYLIREGVSSVRRTPVSSAVTILTIVVALLLVGVFRYTSLNLEALVSSMRSQVELEAFLLPVDGVQIDQLRSQMLSVNGVDSVHFVSAAEAAHIFEQQTGEKVTAILDSNPFPASFRVALRSGQTSSADVGRIAAGIGTLTGIDTVMYRQELVNRIDSIAETTGRIGLIGGSVILLIALVLTVNTIRLAIFAKRNLIATLQLVGATRMFIRIPFVLEGMLHGALGAAITTALIVGSVGAVRQLFPGALMLTPPLLFYVGLAGAGVFLGFVGSMIATLRFISSR